ncbi:EAL domain-containing protein [Desulfovibrio sulfodismutans]|uniref:EAL domain-containing protein n=1 Tax=Desulfolutivibrio sulfodismutans TaxID=63561 RepID=A0A7K3NGG6_9BACT|nr:EAL domain-containing protein [Desulfolutivibrio sulfodismutans]NDY55284.1 EAL domain-containing protein [Desulfolutivibrio sulfodismutans]QLA13011.1 EAL domain-containing protein [Desulfolutivibrio sulfodismutans DSM 3696]
MTHDTTRPDPDDAELLARRLSHLEAVYNSTLDALSKAAALGDFHIGLTTVDSPVPILEETERKARGLVRLTAVAFHLVDEATGQFYPALQSPPQAADTMAALMDTLVEDRSIAWCLSRKKPVIKATGGHRLILHPMATTARIRGFFLGMLDQEPSSIPETTLAFLSIVMQYAAGALESFELYRLIRATNRTLEHKVEELTAARASLEAEVAERKEVERKLARSRDFHLTLFERFPVMIWRCSALGEHDYFNKTWLTFFGRPLEEELGRGFLRSIHPEDLKQAEAVFTAACTDRSAFEREFRIKTAAGEYRWISDHGRPFYDLDGEFGGYIGAASDITDRKRMETELRYQALHDPLTNLPNRSLLMDRISRAQERAQRHPESRFALVFIDLDRFKVINDSLGHLVGDKLLASCGARLGEAVRGLDTLARFGGDEFIVLLEEIASLGEAIKIVKRIRDRLKFPFVIEDKELWVTASFGIVLGGPRPMRAEELLRNANIAMYDAKKLGRNRFKVFSDKMLAAAMSWMNLENELRTGLVNEEFHLLYQPIVDAVDYRLLGFEALLRWRHPSRGVLGPSEFIHIAEESGQIVEIGHQALRLACQTMAAWREQLAPARDLTMSVNLSCKQFRQSDMAERILEALTESGLPPSRLKLEITESAIMENAKNALTVLNKLKASGILIAIDDFGTGYSSLSYLQTFPVDVLKIDRMFISGIGRNKEASDIVQSVVALAKSLGLHVVAEGVEEEGQAEALKVLRCDSIQGFYFFPPLPEAEALALMRRLDGDARGFARLIPSG